MIAMPRAALGRRLGPRKHVEEEQGLAVADARQARTEPARRPALVLVADRRLIPFPILSVGGIRDEIVEGLGGVPVMGKRAAERDVVRVPTGRVLHEEVGLGDRPRLRVHLLAEEVDIRLCVDRRPEPFTVPARPLGNVLLRDHQHAARAAAGVVDGPHYPGAGELPLVAREHEIHHQVDHVTRREVLPRVLVQGFVEPTDQLLEDCPHCRVVDLGPGGGRRPGTAPAPGTGAPPRRAC